MVQEAADYPYSRADYYARGKKDLLVTANLYYEEMGKTGEERRENYRKFLMIDEPYGAILDRALAKV